MLIGRYCIVTGLGLTKDRLGAQVAWAKPGFSNSTWLGEALPEARVMLIGRYCIVTGIRTHKMADWGKPGSLGRAGPGPGWAGLGWAGLLKGLTVRWLWQSSLTLDRWWTISEEGRFFCSLLEGNKMQQRIVLCGTFLMFLSFFLSSHRFPSVKGVNFYGPQSEFIVSGQRLWQRLPVGEEQWEDRPVHEGRRRGALSTAWRPTRVAPCWRPAVWTTMSRYGCPPPRNRPLWRDWKAWVVLPEVYYLHEVCHSCTNLVHGMVPEVYYLHEVCHSCTNLVHGIVPEVYYLHEVCHSCTNLVHGIVPEVYYLHEVCHSCTNLVHGMVPEVYYLHEVCHSCTNLVHGIVPEVYYLHEVCHSCTNLVHGIVPEVYYLHEVCHSCTNLVTA